MDDKKPQKFQHTGISPIIVAAIPPKSSISPLANFLSSERVQPQVKPLAVVAVPSSNSALPPFKGMPPSSGHFTDRISNSQTLLDESANEVSKDENNQV